LRYVPLLVCHLVQAMLTDCTVIAHTHGLFAGDLNHCFILCFHFFRFSFICSTYTSILVKAFVHRGLKRGIC
jgi:hypothetical protein